MEWEKLVTNELKSNFQKYLDQLVDHLKKKKRENKTSLLCGQFAAALFYGNLSKLNASKDYSEEIGLIIEEAFTQVESNKVESDFLNGLAGLGWGINYLCKQNFLDENANEILDDLDELLYLRALEDFENDNFDFFYGGLGYGFYFLERFNSDTSVGKNIEKIIEQLGKKAKEKNGQIYWQNPEDQKDEIIDLSLSHGQAMIIRFLTMALKKNILPDLTGSLLLKATTFIIQHSETSNEGLHFPDCIEKGRPIFSPLRWCHGNLGISSAVLEAGIVLKDEQIKKIAIEAALRATKRLDSKEQILPTVILCHGTLGVGHMFNRLYQKTKLTPFKDAANYWYEETDKKISSEVGFNHYGDDKEYFQERGILCGMEGIGLGLIAAISDFDPKWDSCLLLS